MRTSKTVNGVKHNYYYVDGQLRYEKNGDSYEIYYTYDADGRPVLATKRDLVAKKNYQYYLITNTRGDVIETRNGDGNVNARFVYDAWGKLIAVTNASGTPLSKNSFAYQISLKYRGYVYDNETGLYYLQSRYYDPETGRFLNADDVDYIGYSGEQLSYNAFAYCENEPVNDSDPSGQVSLKLIAFGIQFCLTIGKVTAGFEFVFQKVNNRIQTFLFFFAGLTTSFDLKKTFLNAITNKIKIAKNKMGKLSLDNVSSLSMSIALFVILGNKQAQLTQNYVGWFSGGSIRLWKNIILTGAISKNNKTGAIIGSLGFGLTSSYSRVSFAQTYYFLYKGKDTLKALISSLKNDIYDRVAFLGNLGAILL